MHESLSADGNRQERTQRNPWEETSGQNAQVRKQSTALSLRDFKTTPNQLHPTRLHLTLSCTEIDLNQTPQTTPPQLFLKVGEPLWIRCKAVHVNHGFGLSWELENKALEEVRG